MTNRLLTERDLANKIPCGKRINIDDEIFETLLNPSLKFCRRPKLKNNPLVNYIIESLILEIERNVMNISIN